MEQIKQQKGRNIDFIGIMVFYKDAGRAGMVVYVEDESLEKM